MEISGENIILLHDYINAFEMGTNTEDKYDIPMAPIDDIKAVFKQAGYKINDDWEQNGWQVDFWQTFSKGEKTINFAGSLYYGGFRISLK